MARTYTLQVTQMRHGLIKRFKAKADYRNLLLKVLQSLTGACQVLRGKVLLTPMHYWDD